MDLIVIRYKQEMQITIQNIKYIKYEDIHRKQNMSNNN